MQKLANDDIKEQFKIQQFESQFFEMIRLHKENINEMRISGYGRISSKSYNDKTAELIHTTSEIERFTEGRKTFVTMATELICCYEILEYFADKWGLKILEQSLLELAYQFFFFGSKSEVIFSKTIDELTIDNFRIELNKIRTFHKESFGAENRFTGKDGKVIKLYIKYLPFSGHENRLGHYYRHLYSIVKYVVNSEKEEYFKYQKAREYLKILRSQMSNDEQLMLYFNYIIGFGSDWENEGYLSKYRMLHNLPVDKVKYAEHPREHFKDFIDSIKKGEGDLFEWGDK